MSDDPKDPEVEADAHERQDDVAEHGANTDEDKGDDADGAVDEPTS